MTTAKKQRQKRKQAQPVMVKLFMERGRKHHKHYRNHTAMGSVLAGLALLPGTALAGPQGGVVAHGNASINQGGTLTTIHQTTDRAVIDWQSFNLSAQESARFIQPRTESVTVNRVHDTSASVIAGTLQANGHVVITNPNGVMFTDTARVDVGAITVSTATATDADAAAFASGAKNKLNLSVAGNAGAAIINAGNITAKDAGLVGLVAPRVENSGIIRATKGKVTLASGDTATLDLYGDGLVSIAVSDSTTQQLINQRGLVEADGGTVLITAAAGKTVANGIIRMDGITQARSIGTKDGKIILAAEGSNGSSKGGTSSVTVKGTLDASGSGATSKGGSITVTGDQVTLASASKLNASGTKGGGSIKVGGDYQGKGSTQRAQNLTMEAGATIHADATSKGNGGEVILWSDGRTEFGGLISAKGGTLAGNGGFIETSGKVSLLAAGLVDTRAPNGSFGQWLLDPANITLRSRSYAGGDIDQSSVITTDWLESQLTDINLLADSMFTFHMEGDTLNLVNGNNFTVTAKGNLSNAIRTLSSGSIITSGAGSILIAAEGTNVNGTSGFTLAHALNLTAGGTGSITLSAINTINFATGTADTTITTNGGDIILQADSDNSGQGAVRLNDPRIQLKSNGGDIVIGGGLDPRTGYTGSNSGNNAGIVLNNSTLDASGTSAGGNIILNGGVYASGGASAYGVDIRGNSVLQTSHNGAITIRGVGGATGTVNANHGVFIGSSTVRSANGAINIIGAAPSAASAPIYIGSNTLQTDGGNITLSGATTLGGNQTLNAGTGVLTVDAINAGAYNLSLIANDLNILGELAGSGTLTLQPYSTTRGVWINYGADDGSAFHLSTAELGRLKDGWQLINIGNASSNSANMEIGSATFSDPVRFLYQYRRVVRGNLIGLGDASFTFAGNGSGGWLDIAGNISTQGKIIDFRGMQGSGSGGGVSTLGSATALSTIDSNGGDIFFPGLTAYMGKQLDILSRGGNIQFDSKIVQSSTASATKKFININAGNGTVTFSDTVNGNTDITVTGASITANGAWGGEGQLGNVVLNAVNSLTLPAITAANVGVTVSGASNKITTNAITVGNAGALTLTADNLDILGALTGPNAILTLQPYATNRVVNIAAGTAGFNLNTTELSLIQDNWSLINLGRIDGQDASHIIGGVGTSAIFRSNVNLRYFGGSGTGWSLYNLTMTNGASLTSQKAHIFGQVLTDGGSFTATNYGVYGNGGSIITNGGAININFLSTWDNGPGVTLNSTNGAGTAGNITIGLIQRGGTLNLNNPRAWIFDAGTTGTITINGAVNTNADITANAKNFVLGGAWGGTIALGNVAINSVDSITLPGVRAANLNVSVSGAGNNITTLAGSKLVLTGAGNLSLTADDLVLGDELISTGGTLTLQPYATNRVVNIATGAGGFHLDTTELGLIKDGWAQIYLGRTDNTATMNVGTSDWYDSVWFRGGAVGTARYISGDITLHGAESNFSVAGAGTFNFTNANILTNGGDVTVNANFHATDTSINMNGGDFYTPYQTMLGATGTGLSILTNGGQIRFGHHISGGVAGQLLRLDTGAAGTINVNGGSVNGPFNLTANAGSYIFGGAWGATTPLGSVSLTSVNSLTLPAISAKNIDVTVTGAGNKITTLTGSKLTLTDTGNLTLTADDLVLGDELISTGGKLTLRPYSSAREMSINNASDDGERLHLSTTELSRIRNGWDMIYLGRDDVSGGSGNYVRVGTSTWYDNLTVHGRIAVVAGKITGDAGVNIVFNPTLQNEVYNAGGITAQGNITFDKVLSLFNPVQTPIFNSQGGNITLHSIRGSYSGTTSLHLQSGGGNITIQDQIFNLDAANQTKSLILDAGSGALSFGGTVSGPWNITANAGSMTFGGAWNVGSQLKAINLTSASSITLPGITAESIDITITGAGNGITTLAGSKLAITGAGDMTLTADNLAIGDTVTGNGGALTLRPYTQNRNVWLNAAADDNSGLHLSTAEIALINNGWGKYNIGQVDGTGEIRVGSSNWSGDLNLLSSAVKRFIGDVKSAGAMIVGNEGSVAQIFLQNNGTLESHGEMRLHGNLGVQATSSLKSNGGNITVHNQTVFNGVGNGLTIDSGNGNIRFGHHISGGVTGQVLNINAGTGEARFNARVDGGMDVIASAGSYFFHSHPDTGAWGSQAALRNVTLTALNNDIALRSPLTATGNVIINAGTGTITTNVMNLGAGNLTLTADNVSILRSITGTGTLTIQPYTVSRGMGVGTEDTLDILHLDNTEVANINNGWGNIILGNAATTSWYSYGSSVALNSNLLLRHSGTSGGGWSVYNARMGNGASLTVQRKMQLYGDIITDGGNVSVTNSGRIYAQNGSITTNGGDVSAWVLGTFNTGKGINIVTNGGDITFDAISRDGSSGFGIARSFLLDAGSGALTISGKVDTNAAITANAASINLGDVWGSLITLGDVALTSGSTLDLHGVHSSGNIALVANGLTLATDGVLDAGQDIILRPYTAGRGVSVGANVADTLNISQNLLDGVSYGRNLWIGGYGKAGDAGFVNNAGVLTVDATHAFANPVFFRSAANITFNHFSGLSDSASIDAEARYIQYTLDGTLRLANGANLNLTATHGGIGNIGASGSIIGVRQAGIGGDIIFNAAGNMTTAASSMSTTGDIRQIAGSDITANSRTARNIHLQAGGTLTIAGTQTASGTGNAITLVGDQVLGVTDAYLNTPNGRWLVYVDAIDDNAAAEALTSDFRRYSCSFDGSCPSFPAVGNGVLFKETPILTVTANARDVIYGNGVNLNNYSYTISGYRGTDAANDIRTGSLNGSTSYSAGSNVGQYEINHASGSLLSAMGYGFQYDDNSAGINVTPRTLTPSLTGSITKTYNGNTNATIGQSNIALSNIFGSDDVSIDLGELIASYATRNAGSNIGVQVSGLELTGAKAGNYVLSSTALNQAVGVINRALLSVSAVNAEKVYGNASPTLGYTYTGLVGGDLTANFSGALTRQAGENAGSYIINQGSLAATGNYQIGTFNPGIFTIKKAAITISAPVIGRAYGDQNPVLDWRNATISGLKNGENGSELDALTFAIAPGATPTAAAGNRYAINLGSFADNNYTLAGFNAGILQVNKAPLIIRPVDSNAVQGLPFPVFTVTYTGLKNGESGSVVRGLLVGTEAILTSPAGQYDLVASGGVADNYAISYQPGVFTLVPSDLQVPTTVEQSRIQNNINAATTAMNNSSRLRITTPVPERAAPAAAPAASGTSQQSSPQESSTERDSGDTSSSHTIARERNQAGYNDMSWLVYFTESLKQKFDL
jgi:filamentous hemagglutinin family protein